MRAARRARLAEETARQGVEALLLLGGANVSYATGAAVMSADAGRSALQRPVAVIVAGDPWPHLFTAFREGVPPDHPADHVHAGLWLEAAALAGPYEIDRVVGCLAEIIGTDAIGLAVDELPLTVGAALREALPKAEVWDASLVVGAARVCKNPDELECIRRAQRINELAMLDVQPAAVPGVRQTDLSALFLRHILELGASANVVDPIWQVMPASVARGPRTTTGGVVYPVPTTDRILAEADVIWVDTGISYQGYASDFGRTWVVGRPPTARQRDQAKRWREVVERVLAVVRPGVSGRELTRAACRGETARPWLSHFYLSHGVGCDSAEMPLIGTDLGDDFDESIVLAPGMVLVLEPVIWEDGAGGYRSEDIFAVTDTGYVQLSDYAYLPYT